MAVTAFHAIADPTRRQILDFLRKRGPQRAGDLARRFPRLSRPAVSKHLRVLRGSKLIRHERLGRELWYRLNPQPLSQVQSWVMEYEDFWQENLERLKQSVEK
jgi:DNA-binding transcriptional ArsR family regulator